MNVLVTGANGMIGAAVVTSDAARTVELRTQVGIVHTGERPLPAAMTPGPSVACDITDIDALRTVAEGADVVIHLAGPPSVATPRPTHDTNVWTA